jgi:hypothetical protein
MRVIPANPAPGTCYGADPAFTDERESAPLDVACSVDFYGPTALGLMDAEPSILHHDGPRSPATALLGREPQPPASVGADGGSPTVSR